MFGVGRWRLSRGVLGLVGSVWNILFIHSRRRTSLDIHRGSLDILEHRPCIVTACTAILGVGFYKADVLCYGMRLDSSHSLHQNGICECSNETPRQCNTKSNKMGVAS